MNTHRAYVTALGVGLFCPLAALAQPVLITAPATVGPTDTTITPTAGGPAVPLATADITISNTTLTFNGRHTINSLTLQTNALLTHTAAFEFDYSGGGTDIVSGMNVTIVGAASIDATSRIDLSGRGFGPGNGPGAGQLGGTVGSGGGHGGRGATNGSATGGAIYGSITEPSLLGSGGSHNSSATSGQPGGGSVRLSIGGAFLNNGFVRANGSNTGTSTAGSGAGGSIWISAASIAGTGFIEANGGGGGSRGGGGRVSLSASSSSLSGVVRALGGGSDASPGSVYTLIGGVSTLRFDGTGGETAQYPGLNFPSTDLIVSGGAQIALSGINAFRSVSVSGNGLITHPAGLPAALEVSNDLTVGVNGSINVSGRGFGPGAGPGAGQLGGTVGSGGGHGGVGGPNGTALGGAIYGSITQPTQMGSGGSNNSGGTSGAPGGGALRLTVGGALSIDATGSILANGQNTGSGTAGSGSGGSILISAASLSGAGTIRASGGTGGSRGGGGRIAVTAPISTFSGTMLALEGGFAGTGTIYTDIAGVTTLRYAGNSASAETLQYPDLDFGTTDVIVSGGAFISLSGENEFRSLTVTTNGIVSHAGEGDPLDITVAADVTVAATASLDVSGRGFGPGQGPGAGQLGGTVGSGGGHGGFGAPNGVAAGGGIYGSITQPVQLGSGGSHNSGGTLGAPGGGAIRLSISGALVLDGAIRANGTNTGSTTAGSGSGGSIWIAANSMSGAGSVTANGGGGGSRGGGGRVALHLGSTTYTGTVRASDSGASSGAGTVYSNINGASTLTFDGSGSSSGETTQYPDLDFAATDVIVSNGAKIALRGENEFASLVVQSAGYITHVASGDPLNLSIAGDAIVHTGASLDVSGRGFGPGFGPGAGQFAGGRGSGGGYGGNGASNGATPGGFAYGSPTQPLQLGSGGGGPAGQPGGGAIRLHVGDTLTVNGLIRSNGLNTGSSLSGSGSGGSVYVSAGTMLGTGTVEANGGGGGARGGGGRVAIYSCNYQLLPAQVRALSGGGDSQAGTVHLATATAEVSPQIACRNEVVTLVVTTVGNPGTIQWRREGLPISNGTTPSGAIYAGATTATLTITNAQSAESGTYDAVVTGSCGGATTNTVEVFIDCCPDVNCDFALDGFDVETMERAVGGDLTDFCQSDPDFNGDFALDGFDVEAVEIVVGGGPCP